MGNKLNFKVERNKAIALGTLASLCVTTSCVYLEEKASASIGRVGSVAGKVKTSVVSSSLNRGVGKSSSLPVRLPNVSNTSSKISRRSMSTRTPELITNQTTLTNLASRLNNLEQQRDLETQKSKHILNKTVMVSGLISSGMLVTGVIGGLIQQAQFRDLAKKQAEIDQDVQEDLTNKRYYFQEKEIPEAEQTIIDYYKENYGIDITQ